MTRLIRLILIGLLAMTPSLMPRANAADIATLPLAVVDTPNAAVDLAGRVPDEIKNVGIDEHLGIQLPMDAVFVNERGEERPLRSYFGQGRPVVLQLGYFECPMLCSLVSRGLIDSAKQVGLKVGTDFDMLFVSIDPTETPSLAALKKSSTVEYYGKPDEAGGFHFMVGRRQPIQTLTQTVGFGYQEMAHPQQFAHAAVIFIITPDGNVSRYLYGTKFDPKTLRLSLVEAGQGKIGTPMDKFLLICLHYDAATGKYGWAAIGLMRIAGAFTVLALGGTMFFLLRRESRQRSADPDADRGADPGADQNSSANDTVSDR